MKGGGGGGRKKERKERKGLKKVEKEHYDASEASMIVRNDAGKIEVEYSLHSEGSIKLVLRRSKDHVVKGIKKEKREKRTDNEKKKRNKKTKSKKEKKKNRRYETSLYTRSKQRFFSMLFLSFFFCFVLFSLQYK